MKRSRKIVGSIVLFLASIATSFSFGSGVGFEALLNANPVAALFDANRTAIEIPSSGTSTTSATESDPANLDPSAAFTNNVFCTKPVIKDHTIYVCSGVPFQYKVPNGSDHYVPDGTTYKWFIVPGQSFNISGANSQTNGFQTSFTGTVPGKTLINTNSSGQREQIIYEVTPMGPGSVGCQGNTFRLTNNKDIIPRLPLREKGFNHISTEVWRITDKININENFYKNCINTNGFNEYKNCIESLDETEIKIEDHFNYMGLNYKC